MVNQPTVRRRSTSGLRTDRPGPPRSTATAPSPTVAAIVRLSAASRISSIGNRSRRRASSISLVSETVSVDDNLARSSTPGGSETSEPTTRRVAFVAVSSQKSRLSTTAGCVASAAQRCDHSRPRCGDRLQRNVFARQPLPERGEDVGEQDVARRVVAHDPVHTDREVARTARQAADIGGGQRRARQVLFADLLFAGCRTPLRAPAGFRARCRREATVWPVRRIPAVRRRAAPMFPRAARSAAAAHRDGWSRR